MRLMNNLTYEQVDGLFTYKPDTGDLRWKVAPKFTTIMIGDIAGYIHKVSGYRVVRIGGVAAGHAYFTHRLAFLLMTGEWPVEFIDHIDGNRHNNEWSNLRQANSFQNAANRKIHRNNQSGFKGVCWIPADKRWRARVKKDNRVVFTMLFDRRDDAVAAYISAAKVHHLEFARICGNGDSELRDPRSLGLAGQVT